MALMCLVCSQENLLISHVHLLIQYNRIGPIYNSLSDLINGLVTVEFVGFLVGLLIEGTLSKFFISSNGVPMFVSILSTRNIQIDFNHIILLL